MTTEGMSAYTEKLMQIAKVIIDQIAILSPMFLPLAGAREFKVLSQNSDREGGVQFEVSGNYHKGYVRVELDWSDEYRIVFLSKEEKEIMRYTGIHFSELISALKWIDTGNKY